MSSARLRMPVLARGEQPAITIPFNPVYMVELEPDVHVAPLTWSPEQVAHFLSFHEDHRMIFLWRLALLRGFRRGELCGMADDDFDDEEGAITVNAALLEIGGKLVWGKPKSKAGERVVGLDDDSVEERRAHRTRRKRERLAVGGPWKDSGLMFTNELGESLRPDRVSALFKELSAEAGLPVIKLHAARHTAATLALEAGVDVKVVSDQLGHSTTTITRDTYTHGGCSTGTRPRRWSPSWRRRTLEEGRLLTTSITGCVRSASVRGVAGSDSATVSCAPSQFRCGGAGGARTHDRQIMSPLL
jgi:hypothetical protein